MSLSQNQEPDPGVILLAEDDPADRKLILKAFEKSESVHQIKIVRDGDDLLDYLGKTGRFTDPEDAPRPSLVLLDLNMPGKDGRTALREIKQNHDLRRIPVVVLSTSDHVKDIVQCYDLGANSFVTKPSSFPELIAIAEQIESYWFETVERPIY